VTKSKETNKNKDDQLEVDVTIDETNTVDSEKNLIDILKTMKQGKTEVDFDKLIALGLQMKEELAIIANKRDEYLAISQRFKADFENFKRRSQKQAENNVRYSSERIISKIFEPIEDVDRAIKFAKEKQLDTIPLDGVEIIYNKLARILEDEGVTLITPNPGEDFDPNFHEAVCVDPVGKEKPGKVVQTLEKGYKMKDRVLRAAKIMVSAEQDDDADE